MPLPEALGEMARAASAVMQTLEWTTPAGGSLTVIGTGIRAITQLTIEAVALMADAEVLVHVIGEPIQEDAIRAINPAATTMTGYYADGMVRSATYEAMVQEVLASVQAGKRTVAAFYGHPGVCTNPCGARAPPVFRRECCPRSPRRTAFLRTSVSIRATAANRMKPPTSC